MPMMKAFETYIKAPKENDNDRRSNANVNSENPMGAMLGFGGTLSKEAYLADIPEEFSEAHKSGAIHIHDLDFYDMTTTCCQIHLGKLFETGFGNMRPPKHVQAAFMQMCIAIQSNQNDQYGGQSIVDYDIALGRVLAKCEALNKQRYTGFGWLDAEHITQEELEQGSEAMIHNLNTMNSRAGAQVPFSSINYGLGAAYLAEKGEKRASYWANQAVLAVLKATQRGLANGEAARYPIQIYRIKDGVNALDDPYWQTTVNALECTSRRAYPNYIFIDNAGNLEDFRLDDERTHVATMGCRTRVFADIHGESTSYGRGNASFCTINLPQIALLSDTIEDFYYNLKEKMDLVRDQLAYRFDRQCRRRPSSYPSLVGDGIGIASEQCVENGWMEPMLKHFSLSIGFIGLAEVRNIFLRKDIWHDTLQIVHFMRKTCDEYAEKSGLNYSLLATPAEGVCERLLNIDRERFGVIEGVTDRDYYTNSYHIPVSTKMSIFHKLSFEAPYHALCNAGHISTIELDGDTRSNQQAMQDILLYMLKCGIGYGAFNVRLDHCNDCHNDGYISDTCDKCGSDNISRLRRITGYLAYLPNFNNGKKAEVADRVFHRYEQGESMHKHNPDIPPMSHNYFIGVDLAKGEDNADNTV